MWNKLVLTAGSESQSLIFQDLLTRIPTSQYAEFVETVTDDSPGIRIGSGGATLNIIRRAFEKKNVESLAGTKMLLLHSGGLSQRMPHLSAYGKAFATLPNRMTILETKLNIYKNSVLNKLPSTGGIMITASDVIEKMDQVEHVESDVDVLIFAHISSVEVGTQHGVFVLDKDSGRVRRVLQKPSVDEMQKEGAVREDGTVLTDSCYFMSWNFCKRLIANPLLQCTFTEELCCYGDFMRPMGYDPKLDYIHESSSKLATYRKALADVFSTAKIKISILGASSFFHFGTYREYTEHLLPNSEYRLAFPDAFKTNVVFSNGIESIPSSSFVEYSKGTAARIGMSSVASGIDAGHIPIEIPSNAVVFTMALKTKKFVSIILKIDDDIKKKCNNLKWNGHHTGIDETSLWEAPIFGIFETRRNSLEIALREWQNGINNMDVERVSIAEALAIHDFEADMDWRSHLITL